jgi:hypothetical protein
VKKRYPFGELFVKAGKGLALLLILAGIGYCLVEYSEAGAAASAAAYQPSASLQRALDQLEKSFSATAEIVRTFNGSSDLTTPQLEMPQFPKSIGSNADFASAGRTLARIDQERQQLKQSLVSRFDASIKSIEEKLRAYAEKVRSLPQPNLPAALSTPVPAPTPPSASSQERESLFSSSLNPNEVDKRSATLARRKEFLKLLQSKAENPENRDKLGEAANQLELLGKLLPEKTGAQAEPADESQADQHRVPLLSERVETELGKVRGEIGQIMLTDWSLDGAFERANDLMSVEREKCRVSALAQKGIWLSAVSRILIGLLVAIVGSFLILVCADLVATFLDTAEHTGVVAEAISTLRGQLLGGNGSNNHKSSKN